MSGTETDADVGRQILITFCCGFGNLLHISFPLQRRRNGVVCYFILFGSF
jgi:hypothetical protein